MGLCVNQQFSLLSVPRSPFRCNILGGRKRLGGRYTVVLILLSSLAGSGAISMNGASIQDSGLVGAPGVMNTPMPSTLPPSLVSFMQDNGLPQEVYKGADEIERYVRANPRRPLGLRELEEALGHAPRPVPWLPELFSLPASVKVAASNAYKEGRLYGIDLSSAAAVKILGPKPGDVVLDLCCAPGAKLCMISDIVCPPEEHGGKQGYTIGVDVSFQRYRHSNVRLYLGDGQTIAVPCPSRTSSGEAAAERLDFLKRRSECKRSRKGFKKRRRREAGQDVARHESGAEGVEDVQLDTKKGCGAWLTEFFHETGDGDCGWSWRRGCKMGGSPGDTEMAEGKGVAGKDDWCECSGFERFDKVLVDAECTHDGSVKHIAKLAGDDEARDKAFRDKVFDQERTGALQNLQRGLLLNGFRHLRPGGYLVYSTCSFSRKQNDEIVQWLLDTQPKSRPAAIHNRAEIPCCEGDSDHIIRFHPAISKSSGLFIAKITKLPA